VLDGLRRGVIQTAPAGRALHLNVRGPAIAADPHLEYHFPLLPTPARETRVNRLGPVSCGEAAIGCKTRRHRSSAAGLLLCRPRRARRAVRGRRARTRRRLPWTLPQRRGNGHRNRGNARAGSLGWPFRPRMQRRGASGRHSCRLRTGRAFRSLLRHEVDLQDRLGGSAGQRVNRPVLQDRQVQDGGQGQRPGEPTAARVRQPVQLVNGPRGGAH
jgi:hypothetical protein